MVKPFERLDDDLRKMAKEIAHLIDIDAPKILGVEGVRHVKENFQKEGFIDRSLTKWKPRQTRDRKGRDITRYRSNRVGRKGELNRYGRKNKGRAILTGHNSGGNKLRNSFRYRVRRRQAILYTYKPYAERHNEGKNGMPQRAFFGASRVRDKRVQKKIRRQLDAIFK